MYVEEEGAAEGTQLPPQYGKDSHRVPVFRPDGCLCRIMADTEVGAKISDSGLQQI